MGARIFWRMRIKDDDCRILYWLIPGSEEETVIFPLCYKRSLSKAMFIRIKPHYQLILIPP
jgi:hypothetical protein